MSSLLILRSSIFVNYSIRTTVLLVVPLRKPRAMPMLTTAMMKNNPTQIIYLELRHHLAQFLSYASKIFLEAKYSLRTSNISDQKFMTAFCGDLNSRLETFCLQSLVELALLQLYPLNLPPANINQHIARLRLRQGVNPHYVAAFLKFELGQLQCLRYSTGTTRIALDYDAVRNIRVPVPSLDIQQEVVHTLQQAVERVRQIRDQISQTYQQAQSKSNAILERNPEA